MKNLYTLLLAMTIVVAGNAQMESGSNCGEAKIIPQIPDSCAVNEHQLNAGEHEQWHKITPETPELRLRVEKPLNDQTEEAHIHKLKLYKGTCGGLVLVEEKDIALNEELKIERTDIAVNEEHFIKLERDPNCGQCSAQGEAFYGLCVEKQLPAGSICATAISLTTDTLCNATDHIMEGTEIWFSFTADSSREKITLNNKVGKITMIEIFTSCSGPNPVSPDKSVDSLLKHIIFDTLGNASDSILNIEAIGFMLGTIYYLRVSGISASEFQICIENLISFPLVVSPSNSACLIENGDNVTICEGQCITLKMNSILNTNSYSVNSIPYNPLSYNAGTQILLGTDDKWSSSILIPFCFNFYGNDYNQFIVSSNGTISFNTAFAGAYSQWKILSSIPDPNLSVNHIFGPWHDINPFAGGHIYFSITGTAPCRNLIISWYQVPMYEQLGSTCGNLLATQQIVLHETTNMIDIYIQNKPLCLDWNGGAAIEGIQNFNGTQATVVPGRNYPTQWSVSNDAWRFTPNGLPPLSLNSWWTVGNTVISSNQNITVCPSQNTTYTANILLNECNSNGIVVISSSITVSVNPQPQANITVSSNNCNRILSANSCSGCTYLWSNGSTSQNITVTQSGTYTVTVTNSNGCKKTASATVTAFPSPTLTVSTVNTCQSASNGSATATATGSLSPYTFLWSNGQTGTIITGLAAGTYTVTVTDANGCTATANGTVVTKLTPTLTVTASPSQICSGQNSTLTATATGGTSPYTYQWSHNLGTGATKTVSPTATTTYTVTVTGSNGCTATASATVGIIVFNVNITATAALCQSVSNGSATANVSGGTSPYSYSWSTNPIQYTQTATGLAAGAYILIVTDANGCTKIASTTIAALASPTVAITATAVCQGSNNGSATVNASGGTTPYTYNWSNGATTQTIAGLSAGTYTVTVTGSNGCTKTASATINSNPLPDAAITGPENDCNNPPLGLAYSVINPVTGVCYTWSVVNGNFLGTPSCNTATVFVHWNIPDGSVGTITLSVTDANGCTNSDTITVFHCCRPKNANGNEPVEIGGKFSSALGSQISGGYYSINGTFTVNNNFTIRDCEVVMGANAKINVQGNFIITSTSGKQTKLYAGCSFMWDGIFLGATSSLNINAFTNHFTFIMDAKNAVVCKNGGTYTITKSVLKNNLKSIVQENDATETLTSNQFVSFTNTLKPYYIGNNSNSATRAISFIELTNVPDVTIGAVGAPNVNSFKNADNGILSIGSKTNVINNNFQNFTLINQNTGIAILAFNSNLTVGGSMTTKNNFTSSYFGVIAFLLQNSALNNTVVNNNIFGNVENGIVVSNFIFGNGTNISVDILSNKFNTFKNGITVYDLPKCTLRVNGNYLDQYSRNTTANSFHRGTGILVKNAQLFTPPVTPEIKDNVFGSATGTQYGSWKNIWTTNVRNALIKGNTMYMRQSNAFITDATYNPSGTVFYGILAESANSNGTQISHNTIQRTAAIAPDNTMVDIMDKLYGISIENTGKVTVAKNTLIRMGSGIHATGACTNSRLYCNTLDNCYNGFFLNNASIGKQGRLASKWLIGETSDNFWTDLAGNVGDRILYQIPSPSIGWFYRTTPYNGFTAFELNPTSGASFFNAGNPLIIVDFQTSSGIPGCNIQLKNFTPEEREGMFGEIVRNEKSFNNHEPEFKIHEKEMAFRELKEDGWLQLGSPDDALFQNFVDSIQLTNTGKLDDVRKAIEQNDLVLAEIKNNSIIPEHLIEENKKTVNEIYIKAAKENRTEFDAMETATLESIACQDPLEGGDAVYSATVMLRRDDICQGSAKMAAPENEEETQKQEISRFVSNNNSLIGEIYPNPNNGNMQLKYFIKENDKAMLHIYDVSGKLLLTQKLNSEMNVLEISNFTFGNGIYYYSITINGETSINKKLVVIK